MKKNLLNILSVSLLFLLGMGCYSTPYGTKFGVPTGIGKDSVEAKYDRTVEEVRAAARTVLEFNGTLTSDDLVRNIVSGFVDTREVIIRINDIGDGITRVIVKARTKNGAPDIETAAEIDKQIAPNLPRN